MRFVGSKLTEISLFLLKLIFYEIHYPTGFCSLHDYSIDGKSHKGAQLFCTVKRYIISKFSQCITHYLDPSAINIMYYVL